ncbi:MAG: hypothetical protein WCG85_27750 [Polyangia bacterium]
MRKTVVALGLAFVFLAALGAKAGAQTNGVDFTLQTNAQTQVLLNATGMTQAQLQTFLTSKLDQLFQATNAAGFIRNFGDAQSFTSKGLGVDYASEATYFEVGGAASFALGMDRTYQPGSTQGFPIQGVGLNATAMAGVSLGFLKIPVMVFGNWMQVPTQRYGAMSGSLDNWGLHAQLRLWGPSRQASVLKTLVRWGGIAITTGFDSSHMGLGVSHDVSSNFSIPNSVTSGVNVDVTGAASGNAVFNIDMTTRSIPVEVTTSVRLLALLTAYGGLGFDWQLGGGSNLDLNMNASMVGHVAGQTLDLGTALVHASANVAPSPAKVRGIVGAQVGLWLLRLFVQVNAANTNPVMASLAVGARLAY